MIKKKFSFVLLIIFLFVLLIDSSAYAERIRVGVADFIDRAPKKYDVYAMPSSINLKKITEDFIKILDSYSDKIEVIASKSSQITNASTAGDFANVAKSEGCKYIVLGALTKFDTDFSYENKGFFLSTSGIKYTYLYNVALDVRIIKADTGKIVFSSSGTGQSVFNQNYKDAMKTFKSKEFQQKTVDNQIKIHNDVFSMASSMAGEKICTFLTGEYPEITSLKANTKSKKKSKNQSKKKNAENASLGTVNINHGSNSGVTENAIYRIFYEGEEIFDFNGNSLGREKFNIAIAQVNSVKTDYCIASVLGGNFSNLHIGDKAELINMEEAQLILENNDFSRNRFSEFMK
ncbi:MAG: hypothetical protein IJQ99_02735 [Synergistaceae bacterium]|nr:hypothetical protein [Synergistaceae bacterium]